MPDPGLRVNTLRSTTGMVHMDVTLTIVEEESHLVADRNRSCSERGEMTGVQGRSGRRCVGGRRQRPSLATRSLLSHVC